MKLTFERINATFEPHCTVESLEKVDEKFVEKPEQRFRLTTFVDELGNKFYDYGLWYKDASQRPGHGGEWSSNPTTINRIFGVHIMECAVKDLTGTHPDIKFAMGISVEDVPLPDCLEKRDYWGIADSLMLKPGYEFPRGKDYFRRTVLDAHGRLVYPI
jgi:hypothetical protein